MKPKMRGERGKEGRGPQIGIMAGEEKKKFKEQGFPRASITPAEGGRRERKEGTSLCINRKKARDTTGAHALSGRVPAHGTYKKGKGKKKRKRRPPSPSRRLPAREEKREGTTEKSQGIDGK